METHFIPLESIQIATPCKADWNKMKGDDQVRFCCSCAKNVYNFSAMTRAEAERLILEKEGDLCVRMYRRADGTVIPGDCSIRITSPHRAKSFFGALIAAIVTVFGGLGMTSVQSAPAKNKQHLAQSSQEERRLQTLISRIKAERKSRQNHRSDNLTQLLEMSQGQVSYVAASPTAKPVKIPTIAHGNRPTGKPAKSDHR